jgi:hypothetical protein
MKRYKKKTIDCLTGHYRSTIDCLTGHHRNKMTSTFVDFLFTSMKPDEYKKIEKNIVSMKIMNILSCLRN